MSCCLSQRSSWRGAFSNRAVLFGHRAALCLSLVLGVLLSNGSAAAQSIIKNGNASRSYKVEIEPRGVFAPFSPPRGNADVGLGGGVNFGINLAPRGFLPTVYDSVALAVGIDTVQYFGGHPTPAECAEWQGSGSEAICVRTRSSNGPALIFYTPVMFQWNFYLTPKWSVFGEPGFTMFFRTARHESLSVGAFPAFFVGGRYHFSNQATLTMRIGYPYTTIGVSFFL
jgi:hypothetical protein